MLGIKLDKKAPRPLYEQLRDAILSAIESGQLKPGDRLPAATSMARQLRVTQSTIRRAIADLAKAGRVSSHVGRGTFVTDPKSAPSSVGVHGDPHPQAQAFAAPVHSVSLEAVRQVRMGVARSLDALGALAAKPGLIRFVSGIPPMDSMREDLIADSMRHVLKNGQSAIAGCGPAAGLDELRQAVANRLTSDGVTVAPEQVLITNGSQQAIWLLAQAAKENNQQVICEMPCYMGIARAFGGAGHWVESIARDSEGPLVEQLESRRFERPPALYLCPQLHNPMGTDLHPARREKLIAWARRAEATLISDEIFRDIRFEGAAPPSLIADAPERTFVVGSLSKSFMPGLRIGWLIAPANRVREFSQMKRAMDIGCPPLTQALAAEILRSGEYDDHIRRMQRLYRIRRDATLQALKQHMPKQVTWTHPPGGFHMWVTLPEGYSSLALFVLAVERGVAISPGPQHDIDHRFVNCFRLSYGSLRPEQIAEGIKNLAEALSELLRHPPTDAALSALGSFV